MKYSVKIDKIIEMLEIYPIGEKTYWDLTKRQIIKLQRLGYFVEETRIIKDILRYSICKQRG